MGDKQVALVTGANRGIGLQIAKDLASHGAAVLAASPSLGETAAASIDGNAHGLRLDVTDRASIDAAVARIRSGFARLDAL